MKKKNIEKREVKIQSKIENFSNLYLFDINPGNDDVTKEFIMGKLSRVVKNISICQHFVILSHSGLKVLKKIVNDANIKFGYIVSDSGARIYNIATKQIIFEKAIEKNDLDGIIHSLIMNDLLMVVSVSSKEYIYSFDYMDSIIFNKLHYIPVNLISSYMSFEEMFKKNNVYSILGFKKTSAYFDKKIELISNIKSDWNVNLYKNTHSSFVLYHSDTSKYDAVLKIMEKIKLNDFNKVHYFGINTVDKDCFNNFKNHLISVLTPLESRNYGNSFYAVNIDAIIASLQSTNKCSNINIKYFNPNSLTTNFNEKTFDTSKLNEQKLV